MLNKLKKNIFAVAGFATLIYFFLLVYSDFNLIIDTFYNFSILTFLSALLIVIISLVLKFIRWHLYLIELDIKISFTDSILIFTSGLIMSISPGKMGELLKSYFIKNKYNIAFSKTASIIFAERIVEFLALIIVSILGVFIYEFGLEYVAILIVGFAILFYISISNKILSKILNVITKIPYLKNKIDNLFILRESLIRIFKPALFYKTLALSIIAWFLEGFGFYIILSSFAANVTVMWTTFVYFIAIIIGAVSLIPGGIGSTEGSLTYLLIKKGLASNIAITSTLIIRIITLWFSVLIGFIAYILFMKSPNKKLNNY